MTSPRDIGNRLRELARADDKTLAGIPESDNVAFHVLDDESNDLLILSWSDVAKALLRRLGESVPEHPSLGKLRNLKG